MKRRSIGSREPKKARQTTKPKQVGAAKARRRPGSSVDDLQQQIERLARELDEAKEREIATTQILRVIRSSPGDLKPVFHTVLENATRICRAKFGVLQLYEDGAFRIGAVHNAPPTFAEAMARREPLMRPTLQHPFTRMVATKEVVQIADLTDSQAYKERDYGIVMLVELASARTFLAVPMLEENEVIGVIAIYRQEVLAFADKQIALLQNFAAQAAIAIENARLFNETKEALERQTATADILKVIASSPSDVQPVFEAIAERSNRLMNGLATSVYSIANDTIHLMAFTRTSPEADAALQAAFPRPLSTTPGGDRIRRGAIVEIPDAEVEWAETPDMLKVVQLRGFRSVLFVPLMRDGTSVGVISVTRRETGRFAPHHVQLLQTFADQAVIAIGNVQLFDEVQARTRDLAESLEHQTATSEVLQAIGGSMADAQPVFERILASTHRLFDCLHVAIFLAPGDGLIHLAARSGSEGMDALDALYPRPVHLTAAPIVLGEGKQRFFPDALHGADVPDSIRRAAQTMGNFSVVITPMMWEGRGVGTITVTRDPNASFNSKELDLLKTFADQAVIAIENARLFNEVQARTRELAASLDDLRAAQDRLVQTEKLASLGQLTAGIAHEIKNPLNFVNNFSALSVELTDELNDILGSAGLTDKTRSEVDELTGLLKDNLGKVVQHGKRADSIVKNMLLHSREGSREQRPADVNALVDESVNLAYHGARAEKSGFEITLQRDFDSNAGTVELFPQEISRALLNLLSNGFYAATKRKAQDGGAGAEPTVLATTKNLGSSVEIRIRDNGAGIPPEVREKIFNPFFTTKPTGEGTGLGLSMAHDIIVKQHGGRIEVETRLGEFTEFIITLPRNNRTAPGIS